MKTKRFLHKSTKAIHGGSIGKSFYGEVSVPIFQNSTFSFPSVEKGAARFAGEDKGYVYTRLGNPTIEAPENNITTLEYGYRGLATATGMAAITSVFLTFLEQNSHVICTASVYGPTRTVLERDFSRFGIKSTFIDTSDLNCVEKAILGSATRIIFVETPANPTIHITDIKGVADIAHRHNILFVVDNTFASPYLQRPLEHNADIVIQSLTKFVKIIWIDLKKYLSYWLPWYIVTKVRVKSRRRNHFCWSGWRIICPVNW